MEWIGEEVEGSVRDGLRAVFGAVILGTMVAQFPAASGIVDPIIAAVGLLLAAPSIEPFLRVVSELDEAGSMGPRRPRT